MIRLLILIIISTIVLAITFTQFKTISTNKKTIAAIGVIGAAFVGILLQAVLPIYQSLLAIVAIALVASWMFMKELEKEQQKKQLQAEKRRSRIPVDAQITEPEIITENLRAPEQPMEETEQHASIETIPVKSYSMESITPERKEP